MDVERYLERIGFEGPLAVDLETLTRLQRSHMTAVPFENLDIALGEGNDDTDRVTVNAQVNVGKILDRGRGGWCFELNGAFALLLEELGFDVIRLGAAVLLDGPSTVIDHLALEVMLDEPYLVDVGFGESFIQPLALNRSGPQDGGIAPFEFIQSPQGTTLTKHVNDIPAPEYRFKRVAHQMADFAAVASSLQQNPTAHWRTKPFATRLLDGGPDRVTLTKDRLKTTQGGTRDKQAVDANEWADVLDYWFGIKAPGNGWVDR